MSAPRRSASPTLIGAPGACLRALPTASAQQNHTAASTSAGNRRPARSRRRRTPTGGCAAPSSVRSAATSPCSASTSDDTPSAVAASTASASASCPASFSSHSRAWSSSTGGDLVLDQAEREPQRHQVVLRTVVQVALDAPPLAVHLGDGPAARHRDLLGVRERGPQLSLQLDPGPAGLEHDSEGVSDVGEQVGALGLQPRHRLAVDRQHADLLAAVPDRHLDQVGDGETGGGAVGPLVGAVTQARPPHGEPADTRAQAESDSLGDSGQVRRGRGRPRRRSTWTGSGR